MFRSLLCCCFSASRLLTPLCTSKSAGSFDFFNVIIRKWRTGNSPPGYWLRFSKRSTMKFHPRNFIARMEWAEIKNCQLKWHNSVSGWDMTGCWITLKLIISVRNIPKNPSNLGNKCETEAASLLKEKNDLARKELVIPEKILNYGLNFLTFAQHKSEITEIKIPPRFQTNLNFKLDFFCVASPIKKKEANLNPKQFSFLFPIHF